MAKNVTLWGATYPDVPAITVPSGQTTATFTDTSPTTAIDSDVAQGKIYFKADGTQSTGTAISERMLITDTTDTDGGTIREITGVEYTEPQFPHTLTISFIDNSSAPGKLIVLYLVYQNGIITSKTYTPAIYSGDTVTIPIPGSNVYKTVLVGTTKVTTGEVELVTQSSTRVNMYYLEGAYYVLNCKSTNTLPTCEITIVRQDITLT